MRLIGVTGLITLYDNDQRPGPAAFGESLPFFTP
jgi:hypothetical protein